MTFFSIRDDIWQFLGVIAVVLGIIVVVALVGLLLLMRSIRSLRVPRDADFFTTLRMVPLLLVVLLDLLDLGLDMLSAPLIWLILDRMGLRSLRNKATIEAIIPFSGPIPTFTLAWIVARLFNLGDPAARYIDQYVDVPDIRRSSSEQRRINSVDIDSYR